MPEKIIDKMNACVAEGKPFFSFEYFPPKTPDGVDNLFARMERMVSYAPTFADITWGAGGSTADLTLDIADRMQNEINVECMMHLTCTNMPEDKLKTALASLKTSGVKNILALRGDPPQGQEKFEVVDGGFSCALDLVRYIRNETGDHFGIGVSGYPEAHPDAIVEDKEQMEKNYWSDIRYLKEKLDAGADFVVTQLFYDTDIFIKWVKDCRSIGITAPIIPGIMPIMAYGGFHRMTSFCKTYVPKEVQDKVESLKDDDAGLKEYGVQFAVAMCQKILDAKVSPGLHMYSLNQDRSVLAILERLGLMDTSTPVRTLPFRPSTRIQTEGVRPVNWQLRPKSYVQRTFGWSTLPAASWAEAKGQEFAEPAERFMKQHTRSDKHKAAATEAWGSPASLEDVKALFGKFLSNESCPFPWAEASLPAGCSAVVPQLQKMVASGYLPINALSQVSGLPSADKANGWGPAGGQVFQKGFVEFFCSPEAFKQLETTLKGSKSLSYSATTASGEVTGNIKTTAVSWGVFPGAEVQQALVCSADSFKAWASEAFGLWSMWADVLEAGSPGKALLQDIQKSWYLVQVVEENYSAGDVFSFL